MINLGTIAIPNETKVILWDMDGVLVDSLTLDLEVVNILLKKYVGPEAEVQRDFIRSIFAFDIPKFWTLILERVERDARMVVPNAQRTSIVEEYVDLRRRTQFPLGPGIKNTLEAANRGGIRNAVVSNNPKREVEQILEASGIRAQFELVIGNDAEPGMKKKPAPDIYHYALRALAVAPRDAVVVEDSLIGVKAGKDAGCYVIGVATGGTTLNELASSPFVDRTYEDFSQNRALEIVQMAKVDPLAAERLVLEYIKKVNPALGAKTISIQQSKLSLNSVNGFVVTQNRTYFFKFHSEAGEEQSLADSEYYNANLLAELGLPMVKPVYVNREPGSQFVLYEKIEAPTAFELCEKGEVEKFLKAERVLCRKIIRAYLKSLARVGADENARSSLNQLFFSRLVASKPSISRLEAYYLGANVTLPDGAKIPFKNLMKMHWTVNGTQYGETLGEIIANSKALLDPRKEKLVPTVVGHGDDHNGNKFFVNGKFILFDPAFAGRQPALLSFVKATVHNTFLHPDWLYDPKKLEGKLEMSVSADGKNINITHNWELNRVAPTRLRILELYATEVWIPLLSEMKRRGWLPSYWKEYLRAAFFCCPFLVKNLIDPKVYMPRQSLLALAKCVELGSPGEAQTNVEWFLTRIEKNI